MGPIASVEDKRRLATVKCGLSVPSSSGKSLEHSTYMAPGPRTKLSVPSSSGKSLEHMEGPACPAGSAAFSPLFIGEVSGTGSDMNPPAHKKVFQSPLHRGSLWNYSMYLS